MRFHFNLGGGDPDRRLYRHRRVRASEYYRPSIFVSFGPLGSAIISGFFTAIGGFLVLIGLLGNLMLLFIGAFLVLVGVFGVRNNIRKLKYNRQMENRSKRDDKNIDE